MLPPRTKEEKELNTIPLFVMDAFGEWGSYVKNMPVIDTDRSAGRLHECPICGKAYWSCFGHARRHWQKHERFIKARSEENNDGRTD